MKQYYIYINNEQQGPYNLEQLKGMPLQPDTSIWYEGLPDWLRADQLPELKPVNLPPPPPQPQPVTPAPVPMTQPAPVYIYQQGALPEKKKSNIGTVLVTVALLAILGVLGFLYLDSINSTSSSSYGSSYQEPKLNKEQARPLDYLKISGSWEYDFMTKRRIFADVYVVNNALETAYTKIKIRLKQYSDSGVLLGESDHNFDRIVYPLDSKSNRLKFNVDRSAKVFEFSVVGAEYYFDGYGD